MSDEEKKIKRIRAEENKEKRKMFAKVADSTTPHMNPNQFNQNSDHTIKSILHRHTTEDTHLIPKQNSNLFNADNQSISTYEPNTDTQNRLHLNPNAMSYSPQLQNSNNYSEFNHQHRQSSSDTKSGEYAQPKNEIIPKNLERNKIPDIVYQKTVEVQFARMPIKQYINDADNMELNEFENSKLSELSLATSILDNSMPFVSSEPSG